ncbi:SRPBCC domain-containing protein [Actinomadura sp. GC306]|uniref:SRPBCC domain-containing protein n=1 Tax=Actinomadura sp. GC306 TaxID=2530367 RepID=UPI0024430667|nr:SRPBCC domain-containing protein [Actinomadura sp. GC306]
MAGAGQHERSRPRVRCPRGRLLPGLAYLHSQDEVRKSSAHTDTYHGHFVKLVPDEQVVEVFEFETGAPELRGEVTMTTTLAEADGGTEITMVQDGMPDSVSPSDNELGMRMALDNLAKLVEG